MEHNRDWREAIEILKLVSKEWTEHATYAANCIAEIRLKMTATQ